MSTDTLVARAPATDPRLDWTPETYKYLVLTVQDAGAARATVQPDMHDADFLAGALAVMQALGLEPHRWPFSWTIGLMFSNRSPLRKQPQPEETPDECQPT